MIRITMQNGKTIDIELDPTAAPITCENFLKLVNQGFYNGLPFPRVLPGGLIQGGCPMGRGSGGPGGHSTGEFAATGVGATDWNAQPRTPGVMEKVEVIG